jgi:hypothetical protein
MKSGALVNNHATNGGGIYLNAYSNGVNVVATVTIDGGSISGNEATSNGGGIYAYGDTSNSSSYRAYPTLNMNGGAITGNTAGANGGGVYAYAHVSSSGVTGAIPTVNLNDGAIADNTSVQSGGGVYIKIRVVFRYFHIGDTEFIKRFLPVIRVGGDFEKAFEAVYRGNGAIGGKEIVGVAKSRFRERIFV